MYAEYGPEVREVYPSAKKPLTLIKAANGTVSGYVSEFSGVLKSPPKEQVEITVNYGNSTGVLYSETFRITPKTTVISEYVHSILISQFWAKMKVLLVIGSN